MTDDGSYLGTRRRAQLVRLFNGQGGLCWYCGEPMTLELGYRNTATRDHVIPRSKGGPTEYWNLVAACFIDNQRKGSMSAERFMSKFNPSPATT